MKKNWKSVLAGLLSVALLPVMPVETTALEWESWATQVVVGVGENYCIIAEESGKTNRIYKSENLLPEDSEPLVPGDMILLNVDFCPDPEGLADRITGSLAYLTSPKPGMGMVQKTGSVLDEGETALFTVTEMSDWCRLTDGDKVYNIYTDWMDSGYEQLGDVDWSAVEIGDMLECYVVGGVPVIAKEKVQTEEAALSSRYFIVTGVDADGDYVITDGEGYAFDLRGVQAAEGLPEGSEPLMLGDVFRLSQDAGYYQTAAGGNRTNLMTIFSYDDKEGEFPLKPGMIRKTGSVLEDMQTAEYVVSIDSWNVPSLSDGVNDYRMISGWQFGDSYERLGSLDWSEVEEGDTLTCIVYDGRPVIALEKVQTEEETSVSYAMIIVGASEGGYIVLDKSDNAYSVSASQLEQGLPEGSEKLVPGDVIGFTQRVDCMSTVLGGNVVNNMSIFLYDEESYQEHPLEPGTVVKVDSVLENMQTAEYLAGGYTYGQELYQGDELCSRMITSWQVGDGYERLGNVDWLNVEPGDTLKCIVYDGRPVIALEVVSTTLDENGESYYDYAYLGEYYSVYRLYTDTFKYTNHGYHTQMDLTSDVYYENGRLRTDATNANYVVTGVFCAPGETKPAYYTVNALGSNRVRYDHSSNIDAEELSEYLGDQILQVGDLLHIEYEWYKVDTPRDVKLQHEETDGIDTIVEYAGNGLELFGEDFRKVLRHELDETPVLQEGREEYYLNTASNVFDKGKITDDDNIDLLDVIAVNKNLMVGYDIGYIGRLSADVDNNGVVNAVDSLNILKYVVGLIDSFEEVQS